MYFVLLVLLTLSILEISDATLSSSDKKSKSTIVEIKGPITQDVQVRNLISEKPRWKDIVQNHAAYSRSTDKRNINGMVLAYVTPWNSHGYDVAKMFGGKFTHVSPVWLQAKRQAGHNFITGIHDIDSSWVKQVRSAGKSTGVKIVPRIIVEGWSVPDYDEFLRSPEQREILAKDIIGVIKTHGLDGIVLEIWSQFPSITNVRNRLAVALKHMASIFKKAGHTFILVIPPPVYSRDQLGVFGADELNILADDVDAFSLMSYDFSNFQSPGPNSPAWWVQDCVTRLVPDPDSPLRAKILTGLNLYGLDYSITGGSHIIGSQYVELLAKYKPKFVYDSKSEEHFFEYKPKEGRRTVFYPSLLSVQKRVQLLQQLGTGASLWEVGQGLDYFYDLL